MGYRSDVVYWFKGKAAQAVVMEHMSAHPNQECFDELTIVGDGVYFISEHTKWYDGYESVDWHNALYGLASSYEDQEMSGQFVRIGEETDDIVQEHFGDPWGDPAEIRVCVSLDYAFPSPEEAATNRKE